MGKLALAAKITHVPSMYLSELPGKNHGCRQGAIDGHKEISKRCRELGVDTIIVFDTHWLVNSAYHINCADHPGYWCGVSRAADGDIRPGVQGGSLTVLTAAVYAYGVPF